MSSGYLVAPCRSRLDLLLELAIVREQVINRSVLYYSKPPMVNWTRWCSGYGVSDIVIERSRVQLYSGRCIAG